MYSKYGLQRSALTPAKRFAFLDQDVNRIHVSSCTCFQNVGAQAAALRRPRRFATARHALHLEHPCRALPI